MKYYFLLLVTICPVFFLLPACKKTLEENPRSSISPDTYFTSPESYESAVIGVYDGLPLNVTALNEMFSDIYGTPQPAEQALPVYQNQPSANFYSSGTAWSVPYAMIKNANFILDKLPAAPLSDAKKIQLTAEARCLRGYAFFYLVQMFGDVPMPLKAATNYKDVQLPRTPQADVYNQLLGDLEYAEANLPDGAAQQGRLYKLVATALLAKVYLTTAGNPMHLTANYTKARDKALAVISSGKFTLRDDYATVFHNTAYTSESIWEKQYIPGRTSNPLHSLASPAPGYQPIILPATWFINSYPAGDQRKAWGIKINYPSPAGGTLPAFFTKFVDLTTIDQNIGPSTVLVPYSFPILRLAEMYLIAAEAENEVNGPAMAYQYVNKIRWRARINKSSITDVPDLKGLTKDQLRDAIIMERKWELSNEGDAWFDLKRTNTFQHIQTVRGSSLSVPIGPYNQTWLIPAQEITNNNIQQNPQYH
ncbi:RagB/SusD family nutrient uptake outer membrane protein [Chitinophaga sp. Ak27]|uniref:RagB/SusD family nutrient uptake outer membrane protein n=1 Tax=Chitinophaga sp. Ak27 TaxID=2726116 RepID=UPI00145FBC67|nr:RagB/SusD family nutrient uptake outer membrane protein [Chitinophaga sp. Ak27]NLU92091.1 RagB/SusD family nutrient uptake outer membrane protein [Chitinophaga sp. Ak27]